MRRLFLFGILFLMVGVTYAYTTPQPFMNLYFDFTGSSTPGFPANQKTIPQILVDAEDQQQSNKNDNRLLILLINSTIYIYDNQRQLVYSKLLRTNPSTGFYEMTSLSHIGPALSYLAEIKASGSNAWKPAMQQLLTNIKAVRKLNDTGEWIKQANIQPWKTHESQILAMFDYGLSMSGNYIVSVLNGGKFDLQDVQNNFLKGNKQYPIPFNNIMVGTFMFTALQSMDEIHQEIKDKQIDWPHAMIVIRFVAGANVTAGLTKGTNWFVPFFQALSNNTLLASNIIIAPYADVKSDLGQKVLSEDSYNYYKNQVWMSTKNREKTAAEVFTSLDTIFVPGRPALPGDYSYSKASDVRDFLVRLKHSLQDPQEMLSNTVGFWMAGELAAKNWQAEKVAIPGFTDGFPEGITAYPTNNPPIGEVK